MKNRKSEENQMNRPFRREGKEKTAWGGIKIATKLLLLVSVAFGAVAFAGCQAIASTTGQNLNSTVWIHLTPSKAVLEGKTLTATLALDFSHEIAELDGNPDEGTLDQLFTFKYPPYDTVGQRMWATKVKKMYGVSVYTLTVVNVPEDEEGVVSVTFNKANVTPPTRAWSLDGEVYDIMLSDDADEDILNDAVYVYPGTAVDYKAAPTLSVSVENTGKASTGALSVALSSTSKFELSTNTLDSIEPNEELGGAFTLEPKLGLSPGAYSETLTVSGAHGISAHFKLNFTVALVYDYTIHGNWSDFGAFIESYYGDADSAAAPATITVINGGVLDAAAMGTINTQVGNAKKYIALDFGDASNSFANGIVTKVGMSDVIKNNSYIKGIVLPEGVTSIEMFAFLQCTSLTSIDLPESVSTIGDSAFQLCTSLTSMDLSAYTSLISIANLAFSQCTSLASIDLPESLSSIEGYAFYACSNLDSITLPESVIAIGVEAFVGCANLSSIELPVSLQSIGLVAFTSCTNLASVQFNSAEINLTLLSESGPFDGDLHTKYAEGGEGTYTRSIPYGTEWTKQQ
jgi:hypothetical protein